MNIVSYCMHCGHDMSDHQIDDCVSCAACQCSYAYVPSGQWIVSGHASAAEALEET